MANTKTYSTTLRDGELLKKINTWLCQFRCTELVRFHAERTTKDSIKVLLEAQDHKRLRILATNPPHQSFLATTKTVPYIWIMFTEPVDLNSFENGSVKLNGTTIGDSSLSLEDSGYTLKIDTTGHTITTSGQYELILDENILHENKVWKLHGERKVIWTTSDHGGSRGGVDAPEPDRSRMEMTKVSIEGQHTERQMLREFYSQFSIDPDAVVATQLVAAFPEFDRTTLLVIHKKGPRIPYVKCATPEYKSTRFMDGAPDAFNIQIGFTDPIDEDEIDGNIYFDDAVVSNVDWELTQGNMLLSITVTPSEYKHHMVKLTNLKAQDYVRDAPYMYSFVMHKFVPDVFSAPDYEELFIWHDDVLQDEALYLDGTDVSLGGDSVINTVGTTPTDLQIIPSAHANVHFFSQATAGENPFIEISGWNATDTQVDTNQLSVDTGGNAHYDATQCHVFETPTGVQFIVQKDGGVQLEPLGSPPTCPVTGGGLYSDGVNLFFGRA